MIGVVVATHGKLAEEMIRTAEAVVGRLEQVAAVSVVATSPDMRGDLKEAGSLRRNISPLSAVRTPATIFPSVDLPAPFSPTTA